MPSGPTTPGPTTPGPTTAGSAGRAAVRPVVLDTDLGSDVDDALALAVLLGSPELRLLGATTVYGDTVLRARLLTRFAGLAGRRVPCVAGARTPLSGADVWLSGAEGALWTGLDDTAVPLPGDAPPVDDPEDAAAAWIVDLARRNPGLEVVAIGPLTNLARAVDLDPGLTRRLARVWVMGGRYDGSAEDVLTEHNARSDDVAWRRVTRSGLPLTLVGLDVTREVRLSMADVGAIGGWGPLGARLAVETRAWMAHWDEPYDVPHDATTVVRAVRPELFGDRPPGPDVARAATVADRVQADAVRAEILTRIERGCTPAAPRGGPHPTPEESPA